MIKTLFVCHGNICRSVMAEYIFKDKINQLGIADQFEVRSKALSSEELGNDMYYKAKQCLDKHHIPYDKHVATRFDASDYQYYDHIFIMDELNMHYIKKILNNLDKVSYLNGLIDDPWYHNHFDETYIQIAQGIDNYINQLIKEKKINVK